jgi:hypothetical protein
LRAYEWALSFPPISRIRWITKPSVKTYIATFVPPAAHGHSFNIENIAEPRTFLSNHVYASGHCECAGFNNTVCALISRFIDRLLQWQLKWLLMAHIIFCILYCRSSTSSSSDAHFSIGRNYFAMSAAVIVGSGSAIIHAMKPVSISQISHTGLKKAPAAAVWESKIYCLMMLGINLENKESRRRCWDTFSYSIPKGHTSIPFWQLR